MKKIGLLFFIAFAFFLLAQILWTIALIIEDPLFEVKLQRVGHLISHIACVQYLV